MTQIMNLDDDRDLLCSSYDRAFCGHAYSCELLDKMSSSKDRAVLGVLRTLGVLNLDLRNDLGDFQAKLSRRWVWATRSGN